MKLSPQAKNSAQYNRSKKNKINAIQRELRHNPNNISAKKSLEELEK